MEKHGGKIIFMGTSSAFHGGGENSLGYGIGKTGIICLTSCKIWSKEKNYSQCSCSRIHKYKISY